MEFKGRENLLDPDAIARRMNPSDPYRAAVAAGREVITRTRQYLASCQSFAIETTLSSASTLATIREAQEQKFLVRLYYVCLRDAEQNIKRVRERTARGGHFVPDEDVRRRYTRSLQNLLPALLLADEAFVFDNSGDKPRPVLLTRHGGIVWRAETEPPWLARACEELAGRTAAAQ